MRRIVLPLPFAALLWALPAGAQSPPADNSAGKQLVFSRCFQCHTDTMFRDQRQDRRAWEATIFRMMGRGALFTAEERSQIADYLATDFGPKVPPRAPEAAH